MQTGHCLPLSGPGLIPSEVWIFFYFFLGQEFGEIICRRSITSFCSIILGLNPKFFHSSFVVKANILLIGILLCWGMLNLVVLLVFFDKNRLMPAPDFSYIPPHSYITPQHTHTRTHAHTQTHTHTQKHTNTHTHTHTHTYTNPWHLLPLTDMYHPAIWLPQWCKNRKMVILPLLSTIQWGLNTESVNNWHISYLILQKSA